MSLRAASVLVIPPKTPVAAAVQAVCEAEGATFSELRSVDAAIAVLDAAEPSTAGLRAVVVDVSALQWMASSLVELRRRVPLILVGDAPETARVARWSAADDYLFSHEVSEVAMGRALKHAFERRHGKALVQHLLDRDPVTGAPHGTAFRKHVSDALAEARAREGGTVRVVVADLDRFDVVNETFGFDAGDRILREAVARLARIVPRERLGRLYADKIAILVDDRDVQADLALAVKHALEQPYSIDRQDVPLTASLGVASFPADGDTADALLGAATRAMRRAKHVGRNNVQLATESLAPPAIGQKTRERFALERDLRRAVERGELLLHFQPQLDIATRAVLGVEALVRWMRPGVGMVSPGEFVPLLEETGLILPASDWILKAACAEVRSWMDAGLPPLRVSVNVSATQIRQRRLRQGVEAALAESGLPPSLLELELTEGLLIENTGASGAALDALREMGASISLDDFGTGYSSLSYLKRLPIDVVKIDRSFLQEVPRVRTDAAITSVIITLAHELGHKVVAEGVETVEQLDFLRDESCDAAQGFFFSRPLPGDRCLEWIRNHDAGVAGHASGTFPSVEPKTVALVRPRPTGTE